MVERDLPLVSVLVPVYGVEKYVENCLQTIQRQDYKNIEIIVVDDCSPDNSGKIVENIACGDQRIHVFHHEKNMGLSAARNTGIDHASGEYITFVDSDDWIEPDYVSYLMSVMEKTNSDIAISRNFYTSRFHRQVEQDLIKTITPEDMLCDIFYNRIHEGVWNRLYKKSVIGRKRFRLDAKTGEGMQFNTQVVPSARSVGVGLRRVYTYNVDNDSSATKKPNIEKQSYGAMKTIDIMYETLMERNKRLDDALEYQKFTTALYSLTHIVRAKAEKSNKEFTVKMVRLIRGTALHTLTTDINFKQKIKSLCAWISPLGVVRLAIFWRYTMGMKQRI